MTPAAEARRLRLFALGQGLLWWLLPALVFANLPLDVVEGLAWGHGWPVGTYKHPPLQAWMLELAAILGNRSDLGIYATGALSLVTTYWALWRLGRMVMPPSAALMGVMALGSCFYFATSIPEFNPNVLQLPLYALCGLFFWRAHQSGRWLDWLLLGLCGGLGMLSKYSFVLMLAVFALFALIEPRARDLWRRPGPYLAASVAALVFLPHLLWLLRTDFLPLIYAQSRTVQAESVFQLLLWLGKFLLGQMLAILPVGLILWLARRKSDAPSPARLYLTLLAWGPVALMLLLALCTGSKPRDMWGMALWPFIGLWAAERWHSSWDSSRWARGFLVLAMAIMPLAALSGALLSVPFGFRPWRTEFPGKALARAADALWQEQGMRSPLRTVLSDNWYGGNIAWYGQTRPQVMLFGDPVRSHWIPPKAVHDDGALIVWDPRNGRTNAPDWALRYGPVVAQKTVVLPYGKEQVPFALGIVLPAAGKP